MAAKFLNQSGLSYFWGKVKAWVQNYAKVTTTEGVSTITIGSTSITPANPSTATPLMDGTAATGTESKYARGDHRHPSDTSKQDAIGDLADIRSGASAGATAYQKPSGGIPKDDMASAVKTTLGKADTAYQKPSEGIPKTDMASAVQTTLGKADTAYQKPSGGIPSTDMASAVQTSLSKADNAIPSSQKGSANGVCPLNSDSKIDASYLPSYVDDVVEAYARSGQTALSSSWLATGSASGTVITPEAGKIYVLMADSDDYAANSQFRWGGTEYVKLNDGGVSAITNAEIDTIVA